MTATLFLAFLMTGLAALPCEQAYATGPEIQDSITIKETKEPDGTGLKRFPDYTPKLTEDTILDLRPRLSKRINALPKADIDHLGNLLALYADYRDQSYNTPGTYVAGNMILGANEKDYQPSDEELLLMEIGERIRMILTNLSKQQARQTETTHGKESETIEYRRFSFYHVDVMGSGRFFYVNRIETVCIRKINGKWIYTGD